MGYTPNWADAHSRQIRARMPDSKGDFRVQLSRPTCLGLPQFEFRIEACSPLVLIEQCFVWKCRMRIFVIHLHVAVRRRAIEIEEGLFHVLAVISRAHTQGKVRNISTDGKNMNRQDAKSAKETTLRVLPALCVSL